MNTLTNDATQTMEECVRASLDGTMTFPEILGSLKRIGVERYHADYSRKENTYYLANGESYVIALPVFPDSNGKIAQNFSAENVAAAVGQSQRGEHSYLDFVRKTTEAGCVGYFVQLTGRRVQYFGRNGEIHTEVFPS